MQRSIARVSAVIATIACTVAVLVTAPASDAGVRAASTGPRLGPGLHTMNFPKSRATWIYGISSGGELFGRYLDDSGKLHGFTYSGGVWTKVDEPNAGRYGTIVVGIDTAGVLFGTYFNAASSYKGFLKTGSTYIKVSDPMAGTHYDEGTLFEGVNGDGTVVGSYTTATASHGFEDVGGTTFTTVDYKGRGSRVISTSVNDISSAGVMVGGEVSASSRGAGFVLNGGTFTTVKDPAQGPYGQTELNGIAPTSGEMVGAWRLTTSLGWHGFVYKAGKIQPLPTFGVGGTLPVGVTDNGDVAGITYSGRGLAHGFLWVP